MEQISTAHRAIPLHCIDKGRNPRTHFDEAEMGELVDSVRANGIVQPILVRPVGEGRFEIIAGERRVRASTIVFGDQWEIPAMVRDCGDEEADRLALVENVDRADMAATEEAAAAQRVLMRFKGDRIEAAAALGWPMSKMSRRLALNNLTPEVQDALNRRIIKLGHAELLAAVVLDKQNGALAKILELDLSIAQVKAQVATLANDLSAAVFDKAECADCRFNSAQQRALFGEAVADGSCTNGACFTAKTEAHLEVLRVSMLDEAPKVIILRQDSGIEPIRLVPDGKLGVGVEQAKACRSCENFGCTVSAVIGSVGSVEKNICFDAVCHSTKVAVNIKAGLDAAKAEAKQASEAAGEVQGEAQGKKAKAKGVAKAKTPKVSVGVPQRVKDFRLAKWRLMAAKDVFLNRERAMVILVGLALSGNARHINSSKVMEVLDAITKTKHGGIGFTHSLAKAAAVVEGHGQDTALRLAHAMAASAFKEIEERQLRDAMTFLGVQVSAHWKLDHEFMALLTKSEIEALAEELGLAAALGEKEFKKALTGKKDETIKKLLAVEGFDYSKAVPQVMQYEEPKAAGEEEAGAEQDDEGTESGGADDAPVVAGEVAEEAQVTEDEAVTEGQQQTAVAA